MRIYAIIMIILLSSCALAQDNWGEARMVDSEYWEPFIGLYGLYNPSISTNDSILFFNHIEFSHETNTAYSAYFDDQWQTPLVFPYNTIDVFLHQDESYKLYFSAIHSMGYGGLDLWFCEYIDGEWQPCNILVEPVSSEADEKSPSFTHDGSRLYFMRDDNIMYSDRIDGVFTEPVQLPDFINTDQYETHPAIHPGGDRLYFNRAPDPIGYNPNLMLVSYLIGDVWQEPVPLNDNINFYIQNDPYYGYSYKPTFSLDGTKMYFGHVEFAGNGEIMQSIWVSELTVDVPENSAPLPQIIAVSAYPNPFNAETQITITGDPWLVDEISIYDITGSKVRVFKVATSVIWDGKDNRGREVASGLYFVKVGGNDFMKVKKLTLLR
ncbi:MAG: T9SS type A sorting domain-containing protein [candidate division Zixibacteria bacterium]|nr:T9SS type A sorting domain-containing protein [candidate division Zixibacteria bacterium]